MLKNLFNNPWFVACLGVFASIYLGYSIAKPIFFDDGSEVAEGDFVPPFEEHAVTGPAAAAGRMNREVAVVKRERIGWLDNVSRDPFAGTAIEQGMDETQLPKVGALFVSDGVQAAVVNNRLVRVGDKVADFRVTEIGLAHVKLKRYGKSYRLEPEV